MKETKQMRGKDINNTKNSDRMDINKKETNTQEEKKQRKRKIRSCMC